MESVERCGADHAGDNGKSLRFCNSILGYLIGLFRAGGWGEEGRGGEKNGGENAGRVPSNGVH